MRLKKEKYDLIFGIGNACSASQTLRKAGLQFLSFPYDWLTTDPGTDCDQHDIVYRAQWIADGFQDWLCLDDFEKFAEDPVADRAMYRNRRLGLLFLHDFKKSQDLSQQFDSFYQKYDRRIRRLLRLIHGASSILVLRLERPDRNNVADNADCVKALEILRTAFTGKKFSMLTMRLEEGRPFDNLVERQLADGLTEIRFDYRNTSPTRQPYEPDFQHTSMALRKRYSVRDYRTLSKRLSMTIATIRKHIGLCPSH